MFYMMYRTRVRIVHYFRDPVNLARYMYANFLNQSPVNSAMGDVIRLEATSWMECDLQLEHWVAENGYTALAAGVVIGKASLNRDFVLPR